MRTSNKILIGLLLTTIFVISSLFIGVRMKYANGAIVENKQVNSWADVHRIKEPIKAVVVDRLTNLMLIPSDSARMEIGKDGAPLHWEVKEGVLYVQPEGAQQENNTSWRRVELFLPDVDSIAVINSHFSIKNVDASGTVKPVYNFRLVGTEMSVESARGEDLPTLYSAIKIYATGNSSVNFSYNVLVNDMQAKLSLSRFDDGAANFEKLNIQSDSISTIQIKGKNLRKAIITSTE